MEFGGYWWVADLIVLEKQLGVYGSLSSFL